ncbi:MAG: dethiobiotin synthase [Alteromonadaceae bacterium]|nr:dethiobiotin synthase [Alteromonadaceae bacterium]
MTRTYFITGTDTEVGKTYVSCQLLAAAVNAGKTAVGYKPVAAGCEWRDEAWQNEDAMAFLQASNLAVTLNEINPIALQPAIAPHIAAQEAGITISEQVIKDGLAHLQAKQPDVVIMEGAGGWRLPLGDGRFLSQVVQDLALDVIVVVGMRLGCLNHALLTVEAIQADGLNVKGWIANQLNETMPYFNQNLATLEALMPAPLLATVPYGSKPDYGRLAQILS